MRCLIIGNLHDDMHFGLIAVGKKEELVVAAVVAVVVCEGPNATSLGPSRICAQCEIMCVKFAMVTGKSDAQLNARLQKSYKKQDVCIIMLKTLLR